MWGAPQNQQERGKEPPLFYVVDWLPPDFGAVGQYGLMFARAYARTGRRVFLIGLSSADSKNCVENDGTGILEIRRLKAEAYDKSHRVNRLLWTIKTNWRLMMAVATDRESRGAELLFTGSPPFMLAFAVALKLLKGMRLIYRITDFYPEVLIADLGRGSFVLSAIRLATQLLRRCVNVIEVLGEDQRRRLLADGIRADRIVLKRDISPVPVTGSEMPAPRPTGFNGRLMLLYSGNYGVAHDVDTVVDGLVANNRAGDERFALWLNAAGGGADKAEHRLRELNVPVARTKPVPLDALPALLAAADVHLITLRPAFVGYVLPSKVYACIASGKPILFVGPEESDVHLLCTKARGLTYERVAPGDVAGFCAALARLANRLLSPQDCRSAESMSAVLQEPSNV